MNVTGSYIIISIIVLLIIAGTVLFRGSRKKKLTPAAGLAFLFTIAGIVFGENRLPGYSLIGIGILLAVIDIIKTSKIPIR